MIPRNMGHIWIGPFLPPTEWMTSWVKKNPNWEYRIYDNEYLHSREWRLQKHIDEYMKRGFYAGVADMMQYEILYESGGFIAPADGICRESIDDLFVEDKAYTAYENELVRGQLMMPFLAAPKSHPLLLQAIEEIEKIPVEHLNEAYLSTGNLLIGKIVNKAPHLAVVLPSYTFVPRHLIGLQYEGGGKIYADQFFASTFGGYSKKTGTFFGDIKERFDAKKRKKYARRAMRVARKVPIKWGEDT